MKDLLDVHTHTIASIHAYSTLREMVTAAKAKGLSLLGISDHGPAMPGAIHKMYFANFKVIRPEDFGIDIVMGIELNVIDYIGSTDLPERHLRKLDYAIVSLHDVCVPPGTTEQNTSALIGAMRQPKVKIIGHPDNPQFPVDYDALALAAKENHVLLEVNNSSHIPESTRGTAESARALLTACKRHGTMVIVDSDAHIDNDVGRHDAALARLVENDFPEELVINGDPKAFRAWIESD